MASDNRLVGRERECNELRRVMESDRSEFVIVYGRRRVGKTFLIDQYYQGKYDFTFVGDIIFLAKDNLPILLKS